VDESLVARVLELEAEVVDSECELEVSEWAGVAGDVGMDTGPTPPVNADSMLEKKSRPLRRRCAPRLWA